MKNILHQFYLYICIILTLNGCSKDANGDNPPIEKPPTTEHFSGVWITSSASTVLDSKENIKEAITLCKESGINHIFVVVWNNGRTLYPSQVMKELIGIEIMEKYKGRDPLREIVEEAHANDINVHAWFEYGFAASYGQEGGTILQAKPDWAGRDKDGKLLTKNGFVWMNSLHAEVQDFLLSLVREVMQRYDIDGIQGDDRMPAMPSQGGYDDYTRNLYRDEHNGMKPPQDEQDTEWVNWRCRKLTEFMAELYREVKAFNPSLAVSSAPSVYPWGKNEYLQDWPTWLKEGYLDWVIPQHYRYDIDSYQETLSQQLSYVEAKDKKKFLPGILIQNGDYNPTEDYLRKMIECNRRNQVANECFWFYEGLKRFPLFFQNYKNSRAYE